uniref:Ketosynthase family 3 (KS3) domain-containing protein n=1 Tax=Chelydra serpentina TaxID=8475 RepID=A0A8C3SL45_CHESE
ALEDYNRIWGVINISAINQSGRSVTPITRPSQTAQEKLLRSIYLTHVDPSVVQYVEAHGTGTPAGDPTEAESLGSIIGNNRSPKMPVLKIGSVKGNVEMLFQQFVPISLLELTESECEDFSRPEIAQPLLFTLQVALTSLLKHWGIKPVAAVGHSVGEVAAAHCGGFLSLEDAVRVIYHRSRLQAKVTGGKMLVVGNIPVQEISEALGPYSGKVCIAAFNSPSSCTLSGDAVSVSALQKELAQLFSKRDIFLRVLHVPAAYHSHMMDPIVKEMMEHLQYLEKQKPEIEVISTLTGKVASADDFTTGKFWARHARDPVAFTQAIVTSAKEKENVVFVEIGPERALQRYITETLGKQTRVLSSLQTDKEYQTLLSLCEQ